MPVVLIGLLQGISREESIRDAAFAKKPSVGLVRSSVVSVTISAAVELSFDCGCIDVSSLVLSRFYRTNGAPRSAVSTHSDASRKIAKVPRHAPTQSNGSPFPSIGVHRRL
jgi:hypothetical protein